MNDKVRMAVEEFLEIADQREVDRHKFFHDKGLHVESIYSEDWEKTPLFVFEDGDIEATVIPLIRHGLGATIGFSIMPKYFEIVKGDQLLIRGTDIVKLPVIEGRPGSWTVKEKGVINRQN